MSTGTMSLRAALISPLSRSRNTLIKDDCIEGDIIITPVSILQKLSLTAHCRTVGLLRQNIFRVLYS